MKWIGRALAVALCCYSFLLNAQELVFVVAAEEPPLSSEIEGSAVGVIPDITRWLFSLVPEHNVRLKVLPWTRAQLTVREGMADGFMTYASEIRQKYALFTQGVAHTIDFGYLIYRKDHKRRLELEKAKSFEDLKTFKAVVQTGAGWEQDNIPEYIDRVFANNLDIMTHLLLLRKQGDFYIMPPSQAVHYATKFGYQNNLAYTRALFINDAIIPFKVGLRKSLDIADELIIEFDNVLSSSQFQRGVQEIMSRYH